MPGIHSKHSHFISVILGAFVLGSGLSAAPVFSQSADKVDATTLEGKVLFGYQGWFSCPEAGGYWGHWSNGTPAATNLTIDMYPFLGDFQPQELCKAGSMTTGGKQAYLFSSQSPKVVDTHFKWMEEYGLDGVLVQRFIGEAPGKRSSGDVVLKNIMAAALAHGRTFAIEYDLTGGSEANYARDVETDWKYLVDNLKVTSHPCYLHHKGLPVVSLWGPGLSNQTPSNSASMIPFINWFHTDAPQQYRAVYIGGTPAQWRTLNGDARTDPAWNSIYKSMDVVQPWTVGRYADTNGVNSWKRTTLAPDIAQAKANGNLYMPVVFPGFSWSNLHQGTKNQIPRMGGKFLWRQAYNARAAGATMLKFAMFDEVDEGTAMFKVVSQRTQAPDQGYWLTLDADGYKLPPDWYLRIAGEVTKMFHGALPASSAMPLDPSNPAASAIDPLPAQKRDIGLRFNPVSGGMQFRMAAANGTLRIFSPLGSALRSLAIRDGGAFWDEKDARGKALPSGLYLAAVRGPTGGESFSTLVLP